jgi:hypothetical protein
MLGICLVSACYLLLRVTKVSLFLGELRPAMGETLFGASVFYGPEGTETRGNTRECYLLASYLLVICLLSACYLLAICLLSACYLLAICLLSACYPLAIRLLSACYPLAIRLLSACYPLAIRLLSACYPLTIRLLSACYLLAMCLLSACIQYGLVIDQFYVNWLSVASPRRQRHARA